MKIKIVSVSLITILLSIGQVVQVDASQEKVTVCHYSPEESVYSTLKISYAALQSHLNHGDILGSCTPTNLFFDDFNDGNADGWWLGYSHHTPWVPVNWYVQDGKLIQDAIGPDAVIALVENLQVASQIIETNFVTGPGGGYGGVTFWYQSPTQYISVRAYPAAGAIYVEVGDNNIVFNFPTSAVSACATYCNMKVIANSSSGTIDVYINGNYLFTYTLVTPYRIGQSGVFNGNSGAQFDDYRITSN